MSEYQNLRIAIFFLFLFLVENLEPMIVLSNSMYDWVILIVNVYNQPQDALSGSPN